MLFATALSLTLAAHPVRPPVRPFQAHLDARLHAQAHRLAARSPAPTRPAQARPAAR